jgi:hypothetical protein
MEQESVSNEWQLARVVSNAGPEGNVITISETDSHRPHATACAFGTNYLVVWSRDDSSESDYVLTPDGFVFTNVWFPCVFARNVSPSGVAQTNMFRVLRTTFANTNVTVTYGNGGFFVAAMCDTVHPLSSTNVHPSQQWVQVLHSDGSRWHYPVRSLLQSGAPGQVSVAAAAGVFLALYPDKFGRTAPVVLAPGFMPEMQLINLRRTNNGFAAESSLGWPYIETSTNLIDWDGHRLIAELPTLTNSSRLFVRQINGGWMCIEQLRAIEWAKHQWAMDNSLSSLSTPTPSDLYGPSRYLSSALVCPQDGLYFLGALSVKPICTVVGHTL